MRSKVDFFSFFPIVPLKDRAAKKIEGKVREKIQFSHRERTQAFFSCTRVWLDGCLFYVCLWGDGGFEVG